MSSTNLSDRAHETTKLLRRCQGVFSKTPRTLTSPAQFRIARLRGPEGLTTAVLNEKCSCNRIAYHINTGTVTPAHNCIKPGPDAGNAFAFDWKPSPFQFKGRSSCKRAVVKKRFLPGGVYSTRPIQYISDRRPRGLSPQQPDFVAFFFATRNEITLIRILNGTAGYRTDSEGSINSPGCCCRIRTEMVQNKSVCDNDAVIPDICLERRSISTVMYCKD